MARIKKKGLDYFPLNTDFIHDRAVRRLMKREGDSALGILVEILSYIYAGEGYYVRADVCFTKTSRRVCTRRVLMTWNVSSVWRWNTDCSTRFFLSVAAS